MRQCRALDGLIEDRQAFFETAVTDDELIGLYNVGAGMKVERLEISVYEGLLNHAGELDLPNEVTEPLDENLDGEEATHGTHRHTERVDYPAAVRAADRVARPETQSTASRQPRPTADSRG